MNIKSTKSQTSEQVTFFLFACLSFCAFYAFYACKTLLKKKKSLDNLNYHTTVVSSAKLETSAFLMKNIKSFMKSLKKIGPNIDSCGTFLRISRYELKFAFIFTR